PNFPNQYPASKLCIWEIEAHPQYRLPGLPSCERLIFEFGVKPSRALTAFQAGKLALLGQLTPEEVQALRRDTELGASYHEIPGFTTYMMLPNTRQGLFADRDRRRALLASVRAMEGLDLAIGSLGVPAHGLIPPGLPGYVEQPLPPFTADLDLLHKQRIKVALHPIYREAFAALWHALQVRFEHIGVELEVVADTVEGLLDAAQRGTADLFALRWLADYPDADIFASIFHRDLNPLLPLFDHAELRRLVETARQESDADQRHALYREIERLAHDEGFVVPLFYEQLYRFVRPEIRNMGLRFRSPEVAYEQLALAS
ncbi:MAG: ABC transporter substrate-binding protein, partial [Acidobacteriota bacterium]